MFRSLRQSGYIRTDKLPVVLYAGDDPSVRRFGVFPELHPVSAQLPLQLPEKYSQVYFGGYTGKSKPAEAAGVSDLVSVLDALRGSIRPNTRVFVRFNAIHLAVPDIKQKAAYQGYKLLKCVKAGGMHTPDCILVFDSVPEENAFIDVHAALCFLVGIALAASRYMNHMTSFGIIDVKPEIERISYKASAEGTVRKLEPGNKMYYSWLDADIPLPAPSQVLATLDGEKPFMDYDFDNDVYLADVPIAGDAAIADNDDASDKSETSSSESSSFATMSIPLLPPPQPSAPAETVRFDDDDLFNEEETE
jgi:hypothetical protein